MGHRSSERGFTLIEVMMTVAIIGILASVAIPGFQKSVLRAKATERAALLVRLKQAVQDYYVRTGSLAPGGGTLDSGWNPAWPPTPAKRTMATNLPKWNTYFSAPGGGSSLPSEFEGGVLYSYRFVVDDQPDAGTITVTAAGDLDGDGTISYKAITYTRTSGTFQQTAEFPAAGSEDDASSYATF